MDSKSIFIKELYNDYSLKPSSQYILDRYDLIANNYMCYEIYCDNTNYCVFGIVHGHSEVIGLGYLDVSKSIVRALVDFIFKNHPELREISFSNLTFGLGHHVQYKSYKIPLPSTDTVLHKRLSPKGWYNIRRERRLIDEEVGESSFVEYDLNTIPDSLVEQYFEMKGRTHYGGYGLTPKQYLERYHVTNAYALLSGNIVLSIIFSCEQLDDVFLENLTYNTDFSRFSPGQVLYDFYLTRLILKGKNTLYLGGGNYSYKERYGSIKETLYVSKVFRNKLYFACFVLNKLYEKVILSLRINHRK